MLGERLALLCPEKFDEVLSKLRDLVEVHEMISSSNWVVSGDEVLTLEVSKA